MTVLGVCVCGGGKDLALIKVEGVKVGVGIEQTSSSLSVGGVVCVCAGGRWNLAYRLLQQCYTSLCNRVFCNLAV